MYLITLCRIGSHLNERHRRNPEQRLHLSIPSIGFAFLGLRLSYLLFQVIVGGLAARGPLQDRADAGLVAALDLVGGDHHDGLCPHPLSRCLHFRMGARLRRGATFPTGSRCAMTVLDARRQPCLREDSTHASRGLKAMALTPPVILFLDGLVYCSARAVALLSGQPGVGRDLGRLLPHEAPRIIPHHGGGAAYSLPPQSRQHTPVVPWGPTGAPMVAVTLTYFCLHTAGACGWILNWLPAVLTRNSYNLDIKTRAFALLGLVLFCGVVGDILGGIMSDGIPEWKNRPNVRLARFELHGSWALCRRAGLADPVLVRARLTVVALCLSRDLFFSPRSHRPDGSSP